MMTKWWNDPVQRAKFKRDYRKATEHDPSHIETFAHDAAYRDVDWIVVPQMDSGTRQKPKGRRRESKWFEDNFAVVLASKELTRDPRGELSLEQELRRAIRTPEVFNIPDGHKWCIGCGETRTFDKFSPKQDSADGLHPYCKSCRNEQMRKWRASKVAA